MQKLGILDLEARGREVDARKRKSCTTRSRYYAWVKILPNKSKNYAWGR